jgi:hypothetical protein
MLTDLLPILALAGLALLLPLVILAAAKKRQRHCGDKLKHCFWCGEQCTYYQLENEPAKAR